MESIGVKGGEAMGFINQLKYQFKSIRGDKLCITEHLLHGSKGTWHQRLDRHR